MVKGKLCSYGSITSIISRSNAFFVEIKGEDS
jgi:hypothetical protein